MIHEMSLRLKTFVDMEQTDRRNCLFPDQSPFSFLRFYASIGAYVVEDAVGRQRPGRILGSLDHINSSDLEDKTHPRFYPRSAKADRPPIPSCLVVERENSRVAFGVPGRRRRGGTET